MFILSMPQENLIKNLKYPDQRHIFTYVEYFIKNVLKIITRKNIVSLFSNIFVLTRIQYRAGFADFLPRIVLADLLLETFAGFSHNYIAFFSVKTNLPKTLPEYTQ